MGVRGQQRRLDKAVEHPALCSTAQAYSHPASPYTLHLHLTPYTLHLTHRSSHGLVQHDGHRRR